MRISCAALARPCGKKSARILPCACACACALRSSARVLVHIKWRYAECPFHLKSTLDLVVSAAALLL